LAAGTTGGEDIGPESADDSFDRRNRLRKSALERRRTG
jgi:hypothetical protein